ncbi:MAG: type IV secretion system protein [Rickettsiaceae bacterium H1]|nr:type IV secretion system protein [Rickettsiaceae bacterium H1]
MFKKKDNTQDWYGDRLQSVKIQRNILILFILVMLGGVLTSGFIMLSANEFKKIVPFVIEIEKKSGTAILVDPVSVKQYSADTSLAESFLVRYVKARELFNRNTFEYNYYTEVRLLSKPDVYNDFRYWIRISNQDSPINLYANVLSSNIKIKSIQHISSNSVQIRFSLEFKEKNNTITKDKIAFISFSYSTLEMNQNERYVNPLGFQITSYRVDDEFI